MGASQIVETVLLVALTVVFLLASSIKVLPQFFPPEVGNEMDGKFQRYTKVCPTVLLGYEPKPLTYKLVVGITELAAALALILRETRRIGAGILTVVMIGAVQTHVRVNEFSDCAVPVVLGLLSCYFFVKTSRSEPTIKKRSEQRSRRKAD